MEVLVVIGVISIFVGVVGYGFLRGSANATVGMQAAQSIIVGLLTQARSQAVLTGRNAIVLLNNEPGNPDRYLRYLVVAVRSADNSTWEVRDVGTYLPDDCAVVPDPAPSGDWVEAGAVWTSLSSTALEAATEMVAVESTTAESWNQILFTPRGTVGVGNNGRLVVARIVARPPGSTTPFQFVGPANVRGVDLSVYGQTRLVNAPSGF
ncbi:MAG: GspH/FimT family pseudopilin [Opitutaceae bacterium]|nr:GspH/FimT family pseudopilin [Opitutaceae bacterium]